MKVGVWSAQPFHPAERYDTRVCRAHQPLPDDINAVFQMCLFNIRHFIDLLSHVSIEGVLGVFVVVMTCPNSLQAVKLVRGFEVADVTLSCVSG